MSGAAVTITTQATSTNSNWGAFGQSPRLARTVTYKITKTDNASSVVRLTVGNPYGLSGICTHLVTN